MYIGLGIFLLVLGLIFALDVITVDIQGINEGSLGAILIICGLIAIGLSLYLNDRYRRRRTIVDDRPVVERRVVEDAPVVEERRYRRG